MVICTMLHRGLNLGFKCDICFKQYLEESDLIQHLETHKILQQYTCPQCSETYYDEDDFMTHQKRHIDRSQELGSEAGKSHVDGSQEIKSETETCQEVKSEAVSHQKQHDDCRLDLEGETQTLESPKLEDISDSDFYFCSLKTQDLPQQHKKTVTRSRVSGCRRSNNESSYHNETAFIPPYITKQCSESYYDEENFITHQNLHVNGGQEFESEPQTHKKRHFIDGQDFERQEPTHKKRHIKIGQELGSEAQILESLKVENISDSCVQIPEPKSQDLPQQPQKTVTRSRITGHRRSNRQATMRHMSSGSRRSRINVGRRSCRHASTPPSDAAFIPPHTTTLEDIDNSSQFKFKIEGDEFTYEDSNSISAHEHNISMHEPAIRAQNEEPYVREPLLVVDEIKKTAIKSRKFKCDVCAKIFTSRKGLRQHLKTHTDTKIKSHEYNKQKHSEPNLSANELNLGDVENNFFLMKGLKSKHDICAKIFTSRKGLRRHLKTHKDPRIRTHESNKHKDPEPNVSTQEPDIGDDENKKTAIKSLESKCDVCAKIFTNRKGLRRHLKTHKDPRIRTHESNKHKDPEPNVSTQEPDIGDDENKRTAIKSLESKCDVCAKIFTNRKGLGRHLKTHKEKPVYTCIKCGKTFSNKGHLKMHQMVHDKQRSFKCDVCGKKLASKSFLERHSRIHTEKKQTDCHICGKKFTIKSNLIRHIKLHTGQQSQHLVCDVCGNKFWDENDFKLHCKIHKNETKLDCDDCDEKFETLSHLRSHIREKHYKEPEEFTGECKVCLKKYPSRYKLMLHNRVHTNVKPHSCDTCGKSFTQLFYLKQHVRIHTGMRPYECNICGKRFKNAGGLWGHTKWVHSENNDIDMILGSLKPRTCDPTLHLENNNNDTILRSLKPRTNDPPIYSDNNTTILRSLTPHTNEQTLNQ